MSILEGMWPDHTFERTVHFCGVIGRESVTVVGRTN